VGVIKVAPSILSDVELHFESILYEPGITNLLKNYNYMRVGKFCIQKTTSDKCYSVQNCPPPRRLLLTKNLKTLCPLAYLKCPKT
jgi:hypothetical protein